MEITRLPLRKLNILNRGASHYKQPSLEKQLRQEQRKKFNVKKANVVRRGELFPLAFEQLVFPAVCPVLGLAINYFAERREDASPSFDRLDRSRGYEEGNVFVCSWRAAKLRGSSTVEELQKVVDFFSI